MVFCEANPTLLRLGIILYGLRLTFQDIAHVGVAGVIIDLAGAGATRTFVLSWWMGTRLFGMDRETALLIGAGSAICGAAAVMATEPVVRGRAEQVTVAVSTVVVFGTVAIFLYPALYQPAIARYHGFAMSPTAYGGIFYEVRRFTCKWPKWLRPGVQSAKVPQNTAVITKMVRVMMLAPFLVMLSA